MCLFIPPDSAASASENLLAFLLFPHMCLNFLDKIFRIDLASVIRQLVLSGMSPVNGLQHLPYPVSAPHTWENYTFEQLSNDILTYSPHSSELMTRSPRDIAFGIQSKMGTICDLFHSKKEAECLPGLPGWPLTDVTKLAVSLAYICILLSCLSRIVGRSLSVSISDKFAKNSQKYPVELVQGSSAKYTVYADKILKPKASSQLLSYTGLAVAVLVGGAAGMALSSVVVFPRLDKLLVRFK